MNRYELPTSVIIDNVVCDINTDFRDILKLFEVFNDSNLLDEEKLYIALEMFYKTDDYLIDINYAIKQMYLFINAGEEENTSHRNEKPLYNWEQDFNLIVAPVNKVIGTDVRGLEYLHWWTFLSAFMEIGECTFNTYVGIRNKLNKGKKMEKYEKDILKEHRDKIILRRQYDDTTQNLMDEIMGRS